MADKKLMRYGSEGSIAMQTYPYGEWVKYEDAAELEAENKRLREMLEGSDGAVTVIAKKLGTAEARLTTALEVLKALEWVNFQGAKYCPKCAEWERVGHAPDCTLDAVMNKGGATDGR